eukprot:365455-Chlamydomonas_euryale.AAC.4
MHGHEQSHHEQPQELGLAPTDPAAMAAPPLPHVYVSAQSRTSEGQHGDGVSDGRKAVGV